MAIQNMKDLENVVNKCIIKALELTRDEIFELVYMYVLLIISPKHLTLRQQSEHSHD